MTLGTKPVIVTDLSLLTQKCTLGAKTTKANYVDIFVIKFVHNSIVVARVK